MTYLLDRLREPGTLRSLAVVLFGLYGIAPDNPVVEATIQISIIALGIISAVMKERSAAVVQEAAAVVQETRAVVHQTKAVVQEAARETETAASVAKSALQSTAEAAGAMRDAAKILQGRS